MIHTYFSGVDEYKQYVDEVIKDSQDKKEALKNLEE